MNIDKSRLKFFLSTADHSVTKEPYELYHDSGLDMLITLPQPEPSEMGRYYDSDAYISHTDGNRSLFEKAYQAVKRIAMQRKIDLINSVSKKGNLLDIGAGTGDFLAEAKRSRWMVFGSEPNQKARDIAAKKTLGLFPDTSGFEDQSFEVITMWHVLEHVYDLEMQIMELKRLLKTDGTIIIAVPNFKSFDARIYGKFWAAYDVPRHLWHFSRTSIRKLFGNHSFKVVDVLPMKFDAYYVCLLSERYKTGKMNVLPAILNGLKSNLSGAKTKEYSSHIYIIKNK